jgi:hypothetical protein
MPSDGVWCAFHSARRSRVRIVPAEHATLSMASLNGGVPAYLVYRELAGLPVYRQHFPIIGR